MNSLLSAENQVAQTKDGGIFGDQVLNPLFGHLRMVPHHDALGFCVFHRSCPELFLALSLRNCEGASMCIAWPFGHQIKNVASPNCSDTKPSSTGSSRMIPPIFSAWTINRSRRLPAPRSSPVRRAGIDEQ